MILFQGNILPDEELDSVLEKLWDFCVSTIEKRVDIAEKVISACGRIAIGVQSGQYDSMLSPLLAKGNFSPQQLEEAVSFFSEESLRLKYEIELGEMKRGISNRNKEGGIQISLEPLGILFHIAAGNAEGLPFYSVLEGMLVGNVNILKLPSVDDGLSIFILHEIIKAEPVLADYVCVLDVPSTNIKAMKRLADMADGIVVWGGEQAVRAVRTMADPGTRIISWGHKLSFAYVTPEIFEAEDNDAYLSEIYGLARHICETKQLLCSSCQGIFVDTESEEELRSVAERFLKILEEVNREFPEESIGIRGKITISLYNEELEEPETGRSVLRGDGVSVIVSDDSELELSYMFKNCWVKPLSRKNIVRSLKAKRGYLQTVGLICADEERDELSDLLSRTGITRIAHGSDMSHTVPGGTHDGEYPLRRYCLLVEK